MRTPPSSSRVAAERRRQPRAAEQRPIGAPPSAAPFVAPRSAERHQIADERRHGHSRATKPNGSFFGTQPSRAAPWHTSPAGTGAAFLDASSLRAGSAATAAGAPPDLGAASACWACADATGAGASVGPAAAVAEGEPGEALEEGPALGGAAALTAAADWALADAGGSASAVTSARPQAKSPLANQQRSSALRITLVLCLRRGLTSTDAADCSRPGRRSSSGWRTRPRPSRRRRGSAPDS